MIDAAPAEREMLATQIYRECVNRAYPEAEVTFNHSRCVELLAVCANEALERAAQIVEQCPAAQNPFHASNGVREAVVAIRTLKAEG